MLTLKDIDIKIRELTGEDKLDRPFLCEGSPIGCEVFLIGHNPGVSTFFWEFWDKDYGCYKSKWIEKYREERRRDGRRLGPTRENIEKLIRQIGKYRILDTNIYHKYSPDLSKLPKDDCNTSVCDYLIKNIKPKLIFVHGSKAIKYFEALTKDILPKRQFVLAKLINTWVYTDDHLFNWSDVKIKRRGQEISEWCSNNIK